MAIKKLNVTSDFQKVIDRLYELDYGKDTLEKFNESYIKFFLDWQEHPENYVWTVQFGLVRKEEENETE